MPLVIEAGDVVPVKPRVNAVRFMPTARVTPEATRPPSPLLQPPAPPAPPAPPPAWEPTEKQVRFKDTAAHAAAEGDMLFPSWRMKHKVRCEEAVSAKEWREWNTSPSFVEWFVEDIVWPMSEVDVQVMDSRYFVALGQKLHAGKDTKAMELWAKQRKFVGDDQKGDNNMVVLLNWAKGHGATATPQVIDVTPLDVEDPWADARVKK